MPKHTNQFNTRVTRNKVVPWKGIIVFVAVIVIAVIIVDIALRHPFTNSTFSIFKTKHALISENSDLQTTLQQYSADEAQLALLKSENDALKAELGRPNHPSGVLAAMLFPPGRSLYDTFIIDAGKADHITEGMTAYAFGDIALGSVTSVENNRATVTLFSAQGHQLSGSANGSDTAMTLVGRGGGEYEIHMPRDIHFDQGQVITEQSTQAHVLATILEITADPRDPFQVIRAKAPVNLQALKWVLVQ